MSGELRKMLYDLQAAARELSVSVPTLRRWVSGGQIESVRLGRRVLIRREALETFVSRARTRPAAATP